jgi:chromosome segregation ATPase
MYEAQERDMEALRKRVGELEADLATAGSNVHTLRDELQEAQQQMAADAMLIAEAQRGAEIVADTERRLESRIADLEAERDAARAGEARAVEAIKGLLNQLHEFDFEIDGSVEFFDSVQQCRDATDNTQPALDWLAQQRREAAARELNQLGPLGSSKQEVFMVPWSEIKQRIAALANQQPTACPRSEVRGKERFRA